jgi:hypothetical protein
MPESVQDKERRRNVAILCLAILVFSGAVDLFFYTGYYASDDTRYLRAAQQIVTEGTLPAQPDAAARRLAIVGWNALVAWLFGFHVPLIAGSYVVFHQLANLLTFALGRRLFDDSVALLATYCTAMTPLAVTFSTTVLPDLPLTCFLLLSLLLFLSSYDLRARDRTALAWLAMFAAGLSVGCGWMAKETALVVLPFYFVVWLGLEQFRLTRSALVAGSVFALGLIAAFAAEWAILSTLTGHSYTRLQWAVGLRAGAAAVAKRPEGIYPLERLTFIVGHLRTWFVNTRFDYILLACALIYPFLRGRKLTIWGLALWFFAFHTWGSTSLSRYLPPPLQARYFTPMLPLLFLVYGFVALKIVRSVPTAAKRPGWRRGIQALLVAVLVLHPLPGLHASDRWAGKVYSADKVNASLKAIAGALERGGRPVVLSGTVTEYLDLLLECYPTENVLPASQCRVGAPPVVQLSEHGFYYVELFSARRFEEAKRPDGLDDLLHPVILATPMPDEAWLHQQDRVLGPVVIDGRPGVLRRLKRFDCWHKRTEQVAYAITPLAGRHADRHAWSAYLYEWVPDRQVREGHGD